MEDVRIPEIRIIKNKTPIIYLDTNILIGLSRYARGCCTDVYCYEIGKLYDTLSSLMREKQILCASGNQYEEMGASCGRENARNFLFQFANLEFSYPSQIENMQLKSGYRAFVNNETTNVFNVNDIINEVLRVANTSIEIRTLRTHSKEQTEILVKEKQELATKLNNLKNSVSIKYEDRLSSEYESDSQVFRYKLNHCEDSIDDYANFIDELGRVYCCVGMNFDNASQSDKIKAIEDYDRFLLSPYHHGLPYVQIRSVLFAHLMNRQNKVKSSDNLDIKWASAYLPFVDYAITDDSFCRLLNQSELAKKYRTAVYSLKNLSEFFNELQK